MQMPLARLRNGLLPFTSTNATQKQREKGRGTVQQRTLSIGPVTESHSAPPIQKSLLSILTTAATYSQCSQPYSLAALPLGQLDFACLLICSEI